MARTMLKEGYKYGCGLGKNGQGLAFPLEVAENKGRYDLGYRPTWANKKRVAEERKERSKAKLKGHELKGKGITSCSIR